MLRNVKTFMQAESIDDKLLKIAKDLNLDINEIVKKTIENEIKYKIISYEERIKNFEKKYGKKFEEFKKEYLEGKEDFEKYDDLMEWEFCIEAKKFWEDKLREIE